MTACKWHGPYTGEVTGCCVHQRMRDEERENVTSADTKRLTALHDERYHYLRKRRLRGLTVTEERRLRGILDDIDAIEMAEAIERRKPDSFEELFAKLYATLPECSRKSRGCTRKATRVVSANDSAGGWLRLCDRHASDFGKPSAGLPWADIVREQEQS